MSELENKRQLAVGFARFVIRQGSGATIPQPEGSTLPPKTWQARGRELYGAELFSQVMREQLATRQEWEHAKEGLPPVRSDQGVDAEKGQAARGSQDQRGEDLEQPGLSGAVLASASAA